MKRGRRAPVLALALAVIAAAAGAEAPPLESARALVAGLRRSGRAEASLTWTAEGPPGKPPVAIAATLSLEPPALARLDVAATGERITLRADGGEWLQPALRQLVRLTPRHSVAALRWWRLLAGSGAARERRLGPRHYRLLVPATPGADADSAEVWLDARGLPGRLVLSGGAGVPGGYRLSRWRFARARGPGAFRLTAPAGVETVELP